MRMRMRAPPGGSSRPTAHHMPAGGRARCVRSACAASHQVLQSQPAAQREGRRWSGSSKNRESKTEFGENIKNQTGFCPGGEGAGSIQMGGDHKCAEHADGVGVSHALG